jgi:hypothetical protein
MNVPMFSELAVTDSENLPVHDGLAPLAGVKWIARPLCHPTSKRRIFADAEEGLWINGSVGVGLQSWQRSLPRA